MEPQQPRARAFRWRRRPHFHLHERAERSPSVTKQEIDPDGIPQFGLIAEEVEKVNPD
jgi:hypothetical protein